MGVAHGDAQPPPQGERHGLQQPQLQQSQQQPLAEINNSSPMRVEHRRFIPGFLSCGIGS